MEYFDAEGSDALANVAHGGRVRDARLSVVGASATPVESSINSGLRFRRFRLPESVSEAGGSLAASSGDDGWSISSVGGRPGTTGELVADPAGWAIRVVTWSLR